MFAPKVQSDTRDTVAAFAGKCCETVVRGIEGTTGLNGIWDLIQPHAMSEIKQLSGHYPNSFEVLGRFFFQNHKAIANLLGSAIKK